MNGSQNQSNVGEQIKDALADALQSGDFKNLNNLVSQTVTDTLNEVGKQITQGTASQDIPVWQKHAEERAKKKQEQIQKDWQEQLRRRQEELKRQEEFQKQQQRRQQEELKRQEHRRQQELKKQQRRQQNASQQTVSMNVPVVRRKYVGSVSSVVYQVIGGVGLGVTGLILLFCIVFGGFDVWGSMLITDLIFLAVFLGIIQLGVSQKRRLQRAERYVRLCSSKMYGDIKKIAQSIGKSYNYVKKDIQKMLRLGMFPEGHLDEQKTCFMLNDKVYGQYLDAEESRRQQEEERKREEEARKAAQTQKAASEQEVRSAPETELEAMISEGMECICKLRNLNDEIEGEVISRKLFQLENLLKEIFDSLREHPEQMHRMHKLMDYYLPTTLKLVEAYKEFDQISVPGEEVLAAKAEIEKTLDIINQAFKELLNNLFQDAVFDATTDARVLKTMLAREGLTREMELEPVPIERK